MRCKRAVTALLSVATALGLTVGLSPQAEAASHWGSGFIRHQHNRTAGSGPGGYRGWGEVKISWDNHYNVSLDGSVEDDKDDGLPVVGQISYWYWTGSAWKWTKRNLDKDDWDNGGGYGRAVHSRVKVKYVKWRVCTVHPRYGYEIVCGDWD